MQTPLPHSLETPGEVKARLGAMTHAYSLPTCNRPVQRHWVTAIPEKERDMPQPVPVPCFTRSLSVGRKSPPHRSTCLSTCLARWQLTPRCSRRGHLRKTAQQPRNGEAEGGNQATCVSSPETDRHEDHTTRCRGALGRLPTFIPGRRTQKRTTE